MNGFSEVLFCMRISIFIQMVIQKLFNYRFSTNHNRLDRRLDCRYHIMFRKRYWITLTKEISISGEDQGLLIKSKFAKILASASTHFRIHEN